MRASGSGSSVARADGGGHEGAGVSLDWPAGLPVLRLNGVSLREPRLADAAGLHARLTTPSVVKFLPPPPDTVSGFERFITWVQHERQHGRHACYAIIPDDSPNPVGLIQVREIEPDFGTAEWGFALAQPSWGTGLFMECATALVGFLFREVGIHRLEARASVSNGRGNGVLQKLNAVPEGVLRRSFDNGSRITDQVLWSLIASDWLASHLGPTYRLEAPMTQAPEAVFSCADVQRAERWARGLPELRGDRVTLRELSRDDAPALTAAFKDTEVGRYIAPPPADFKAFEHFADWARLQRESGTYFCYAVLPDHDQQAVGIYQIHQVEPPFKTAEWGFAFAKPYWGTGLFSRSACVLLDHLFESLGVKRLEARALADNARANAVLRRLGAVQEGRLRRSFLLGGQYRDDVLWSILDTDWAARGGRAERPAPVGWP